MPEKCEADIAPVQEAIDDVKKRWENISDKLNDAKEKMDKMKDGLNRFEASVVPVSEVCTEVEKALDDEVVFGDDIQEGEKEVDKYKVSSWFI